MNFKVRFVIKYCLFCQTVLFDGLGDVSACRDICGNGIWILIST